MLGRASKSWEEPQMARSAGGWPWHVSVLSSSGVCGRDPLGSHSVAELLFLSLFQMDDMRRWSHLWTGRAHGRGALELSGLRAKRESAYSGPSVCAVRSRVRVLVGVLVPVRYSCLRWMGTQTASRTRG